jgi:RNA polymerase sigma factor (sigma-70 family)
MVEPVAVEKGARMYPERGDRSFEAFFETERDRLYGALCLLTADRQEAEEIVQDAFLALWSRWERVGSLPDPTGYLYRTAMNTFRKRLRRGRVALRRQPATFDAPDELAVAIARRTVMAALATLPPRQRAAVVLTDLLDYSSEDAGRILGVKAGSVRALAHQGRDSMRKAMGGPDG